MDIRELVRTIASTEASDWTPILRPTYRHRFSPRVNAKGEQVGLSAEQHKIHLTCIQNIRITLAYGLVDNANYVIPEPNPFAAENARTHLLDCFWQGRLIFRETVINIDRNRCLLPLPEAWTGEAMEIPVTRFGLVKLIHDLVGPPTDYEDYFMRAGMQKVNRRWP